MSLQTRSVNRTADDVNGAKRGAQGDLLTLEDAEWVTRKLMHDYHLRGDSKLWKALLCDETVWLGSGETMLFGGVAIRDHFHEFVQLGLADILREEYHTLRQGGDVAVVFGKLVTLALDGQNRGRRYCTMFSCYYAEIDGSLRLLMQHYTYEWQGAVLPSHAIDAVHGSQIEAGKGVGLARPASNANATAAAAAATSAGQPLRSGTETAWQSPQMRAAAFLVARNLSVTDADVARIPVHSNSEVIHIDPRTLLYAESHNHRAEVVTLTKAFICNISLGELAALLPDYCCRIHRAYLVNVHYITAIRRSEVELASGKVIPIPAPKYAATKQRLSDMISNFGERKRSA